MIFSSHAYCLEAIDVPLPGAIDFRVRPSPKRGRVFGAAPATLSQGAWAAQYAWLLVSEDRMDFFPGFRRQTIETSGTSINVVTGGSGPPLLLLHGYPQTHIEWRKMAPDLSANYTLVMPDLRGYGDSGKPPAGDNHINYSKRAMALDQIEVMEKLGFREFALVSHDRGSRVAHRLTLDHSGRVTKLVLMDICPTRYMYKTTDKEMASTYFHFFLFIQPAPFPETLIGRSVDETLTFFMGSVIPDSIEPEAY